MLGNNDSSVKRYRFHKKASVIEASVIQLLALMQATALKRTPLLKFSSGYIYEYIFHDFLSNQPFFVLHLFES